ncbi:MAG: radical SAM protein [Acidobacteriota bacterium]
MADRLRVVLIKPSKYANHGAVERFRRGFMPNSTLAYLASLTPAQVGGLRCEVTTIDEYVQTDLEYLAQLRPVADAATLVALVGVQSHQIHRALDLAALARHNGVENVVIGGPHAMTCDTTELQGRGISFALAEAELIWPQILQDAVGSSTAASTNAPSQATMSKRSYGVNQRWQTELDSPVLRPPSRRDLRRYAVPLLGVYPARGCPYVCNFCSVIKIAGRTVRSQPIETTLATLRAAKAAGVRYIMFTSDNFNKIPDAAGLLNAMIEERIRLPFFAQCDAMVYRQEELVELMARAGCFQMFVGAESFSREALRSAHKMQNHPDRYAEILALCRKYGISSHFSNILGFPTDTEASIAEHLRILKSLAPDLASFYVLTPIPGTEQYDEFRRAGVITERNLDRFDGSAVVWRHPNIAPDRLMELLFGAYRSYCAAPSVLHKLARTAGRRWDYRTTGELLAVLGYAVQSRLGARSHSHPMAGGIGRIRRDRVEDYAALRRSTFGVDLIPLPDSLTLSVADQELNRRAKLAVS